jgi:hypothetical protein
MKWLHFVDTIQQKNANPTRKTFNAVLKSANKSKINNSFDRYVKGRLLIENPLLDPLRKISEEEVGAFKHKIGLVSPRKRTCVN